MSTIMWKCVLVAILFTSAAAFANGASAADPAKAEAGARTYEAYCSACHGVKLNNIDPEVTFDLRRLRPDERARFVNSVLNGKNHMPSFRGVLAMEQIDAIWTYIRATVDR
jgi:quinohemoprotein ethanol dehydrogenase